MARSLADFNAHWAWIQENFNYELPASKDGEEPGPVVWHCNRCDDAVWYHTKHAVNVHGDDIEIKPLMSKYDDSDERGWRDQSKPERWKMPQPTRWPDSVDKCPQCQSPSIDHVFTVGDDSTKWRCRSCGDHGSVVSSESCPTCNRETAYVLEPAPLPTG